MGSILLDWLLLEPLAAMRHELTHIAEQRRWANLNPSPSRDRSRIARTRALTLTLTRVRWALARELNARRAGKARAAWLGFMRARRVRRVGEAVVARDPNPVPMPNPEPYPNPVTLNLSLPRSWRGTRRRAWGAALGILASAGPPTSAAAQ